MPTPTRALCVALAAAAVVLTSLVPVAAANGATGGRIVITEWMYNSSADTTSASKGSEFAEFTNTGDAEVDLTGWTFDDSHRVTTALSLSALGTIQPGESFLLTDIAPATFRANWGLPDSVKVLQNNVDGLGNGDEINIWNASGTLQDRLTYPGDKKTDNVSAWVAQGDLGAGQTALDSSTAPTANATNATSSAVGDAVGSWKAANGSIGSPGVSPFGLYGSNPAFVKVNEVESANDTVEVANLSSLPISVAGWLETDDSHAPTAFPTGGAKAPSATTIPAHGYVTLTSSQGLSAGGDSFKLFLPTGAAIDATTWPTGQAEPGSWARCPDGTGAFRNVTTQSFGAANTAACNAVASPIKINEVDSDTDTVELVNTGATAVDVSAWKATDADGAAGGHPLTAITPSTGTMQPGAFATFHSPYGLGAGGDSVSLYLADGVTLVDSVTWTANQAEPGSYARCPADGTGSFLHVSASSFGASNATACQTPYVAPGSVPCDTEAPTGTGPAIAGGVAWPGSQDWTTSDPQCSFVVPGLSGQDISGLVFDPSNSGVLYAAKNKNYVYRLVKSNGQWITDTTNGWGAGKAIVFKDGTGQPDDEAITVGPDGFLYVTTERDNASNQVPRDTVLRFDPSATGATLTPTTEWDLTADLGLSNGTEANLGFEGITFVPDSALTAQGFVDENGATYDPASYPLHGSGLYFVAVEKTAHILAYALNSDGTKAQVADIPTGMPAIAETQWDPDLGKLWAVADNTSSGSTEVLAIEGTGTFVVQKIYDRPTGLPNLNLEGFAIAPSSTCVDGVKEVVRSDDGDNGGHSLWSGTIRCDLGLDAAVSISATAVDAGGDLTFDATGLLPNTRYDVVLHSAPVTIASATSGATGAVHLNVTIPVGTDPGAHTIGIANATAPGTLLATAALTVRPAPGMSAGTIRALAQTGVSVTPVVGLAAALGLLGVGLVVMPRILRRRRAPGPEAG